jgi:hypothetical protein
MVQLTDLGDSAFLQAACLLARFQCCYFIHVYPLLTDLHVQAATFSHWIILAGVCAH